jgi:translation initiation factor 2B subunit (eIF-2B alpha/beta/delta family)
VGAGASQTSLEEFRAGQVDARLDSIEQNQQALWKEMKEMRQGIQDIKITLATNKGFIMAISSGVSAGVAFMTAWFTKRNGG